MKWHWDCCSTTPPTPTPPPASVFSRAEFTYNGDGQTDGVVTKYYYAGSQRIAMRSSGTLYFMLGDHLGSTSLVTFANGNVVSEMRYKAWGEVRYSSAYAPTKYSFTGQYSYQSDFGLMFYNARWYDPYLNHFTQPDTIVPDPSNSQDLNRYTYARYNPLRYTDPTGHCPEEEKECRDRLYKTLQLRKRIVFVGSFQAGVVLKTGEQLAEESYSGGVGTTKPVSGVAPEVPLLPGQRPPDWVTGSDPSAGVGLASDTDTLYSQPDIEDDVFISLEYTQDKDDISLDMLHMENESDYQLYIGLVRFTQKNILGTNTQIYDYSPDLLVC